MDLSFCNATIITTDNKLCVGKFLKEVLSLSNKAN